MPRSNFSITVMGQWFSTYPQGQPFSSGVSSALQSAELVSGTSRRKPKGWLTPLAYNMTHVTTRFQRGVVSTIPDTRSNFVGTVTTGVVGGGSRFAGMAHFDSAINEVDARSDPDQLRNQALLKARAKLKGQSINLGVAFGERNQTARLLGDTASRLARAYRHLRRGQTRRAMDELGISSKRGQPRGGNVPAKWMELQYGWKPFLSDVYGACDALSKRNKDDWNVTAKGRARTYNVYRYQRNLGPSDDIGANVVATVERRALARIDAQPSNETIISLASMGITNPLMIGWELVPFSFVVDWCLPVGAWLDSLDATFGYSIAGYSNSFFVETKWNDDVDATYRNGFTVYRNRYTGSKRLVYLDRQVSSSVPLPAFPRFKDPRSFGHMANGLALLAQVFGKR